jgi:hypothetical protein
MIPIEEQINSDNFLKFCDYFYSPNSHYLYALQVLEKYPHLKMFCPGQPLDKKEGIIFVGMCTQVEMCFQLMPEDGNYVVIQRDNDRQYIEAYHRVRKPSVKHVYTIENTVNHPEKVTALPYGVASIEGPNYTVEQVRLEFMAGRLDLFPQTDRKIFCRININPATPFRKEIVESLRDNPLATVLESQISPLDFMRQIKAHKFCISLGGMGNDTTRTWECLCLGTIPILWDTFAMRQFDDMPVAFYPGHGNMTLEWMDSVSASVSKKSLRRATMSYWKEEILKMAHG